jgi:hypothetical protein
MNTPNYYDIQLLINLGFPLESSYGQCYETVYLGDTNSLIHQGHNDVQTSESSLFYNNEYSINHFQNEITIENISAYPITTNVVTLSSGLDNQINLPSSVSFIQPVSLESSMLIEQSASKPNYNFVSQPIQRYDADALIALGFPIDKNMGDFYETTEGVYNEEHYVLNEYTSNDVNGSLPVSVHNVNEDCLLKYGKPAYPQHLLNISYTSAN